MKTKQIVFTKPYVTEILEKEIQMPKKGEVQVRLAVSTISNGTERANLIGDPNVYIGEEEVPFPRMVGYSSSGIVEIVGEEVQGIKKGDRVAMTGTVHCQILNVPQACVYPIPKGVSFQDGALFYISTFPLAAIRKCRIEIGESAIVMGQGVLGQMAIALLKAAGAAPIIAVDPVTEKREKALKIGADYALDPFTEGFADHVKEITRGGAKVGIEVTGVGSGLDGILDCMARFGRVALLGCTRNKEFTIDYYRKIHGPGITLIGAHTLARPEMESHGGWWTSADDMEALIKLTQLRRIKLSEMIDEIHSPEEADEIYERLANDKMFPLVQFDWRNFQ